LAPEPRVRPVSGGSGIIPTKSLHLSRIFGPALIVLEGIMPADCNLPPIVIHSRDNNDLVVFATVARRMGNPDAEFLLAELRRAQLCAVEALPDDVVSLGSRVTYRVEDASRSMTGTLAFPSEVHRYQDGLSVATRVGTALLGLRAGDPMPFRMRDGQASSVVVERVERPLVDGLDSKAALDRRLDRALEFTFPASDPVSVTCTVYPPTGPAAQSREKAGPAAREDDVKPGIILSESDQRRLTTLASEALTRSPEVAKELLAEIERAQIVPARSVPPGVVQMGSTVHFQSDDGGTRRVELVFPGQADISADRISILTPVGAALIGLSKGQSMPWRARDGRTRRLTVMSVQAPADAD
jgi:regulator of nucleoside diphosphate kinase